MKEKKIEFHDFQNVREIIRNSVEKFADKTAFTIKINKDKNVSYRKITYKKLGRQIDSLGTELIKQGLKDKRVAVISKNRYEWVLSYLAVLNGVGIVVPLDKGLPDQEIISSLQRSRADAVIFEEKYLELMKQIKAEQCTNVKKFIIMDDIEEKGFLNLNQMIKDGDASINSGNREYLDAKIDNDKMSVILFTSGTTSLAKAVMLSHRNIASNVTGMRPYYKFYDTDVNMAFLPFHHTFGSTGIVIMLSDGVNNVFCDGLRYIQENLKEYKVSVFVCVPLILEAMHKRIMKTVEKTGQMKKLEKGKKISKGLLKIGIDVRRKIFKNIIDELGGKLRLVISGAAALNKQVGADFNAFGIYTVQGYGLTETSPVVAAEDEKTLGHGTVGKPLFNVKVKIDNKDKDGIGEIAVKGPSVMLGYYEDEEATNEVLKDGWFYTGDLAYYDEHHCIKITGRKKSVIVLKNGKNIYPEELENLISELPYVAENMVFGYPKGDDLIVSAKIVGYPKGDDLIVSAKIVYNKEFFKGISKDEIESKIWDDIKEINAGLTKFKHIKKIIVTDEPMIKTTTAKVKRFEEIDKILKEDKIR